MDKTELLELVEQAGGLSWSAESVTMSTDELARFAAFILARASDDAVDAAIEEWRTIDGWQGSYEVSSLGNVRSLDRIDSSGKRRNGALMTPYKKAKGYLSVSLFGAGRSDECFVHRLVAQAFIANDANLPMVNHKNGDKTDNRVDNLEWVNASGNALHAARIRGTMFTTPIYGISVSTGERLEFPSFQQAEEAGFTRSLIYKCIKGQRKTHGGFKWWYAAMSGKGGA